MKQCTRLSHRRPAFDNPWLLYNAPLGLGYFDPIYGCGIWLPEPAEATGLWHAVFSAKWTITTISAAVFGLMLIVWFHLSWWKVLLAAAPAVFMAMAFPHEPMIPFAARFIGLSAVISTHGGEMEEWFSSSWGFAKQILPLLLFGVLIAGVLLGRPAQEGLIPAAWISRAVNFVCRQCKGKYPLSCSPSPVCV